MITSTEMRETLARAGQTSDPWGRYYTPSTVSSALIERIEVAKPQLLLELGSGTGSLCTAAVSRWHDATLVTVDVDGLAPNGAGLEQFGAAARHSHFIHDVLDPSLSDKIGLALGTVDVAVCNPPYIRPKWRSGFGKILEDAGLSGALASLHDAGADLLFIAQNLRLLRKNGKLGLILPDGLITAERFSNVRRTLLRQHLIEEVVQLPRRVFKGTDAQTYLMVLSKNAGETDHVVLRQMGLDGQLSTPIKVSQDAATKRLDFNFHSRVAPSEKKRTTSVRVPLRRILTDVVRGAICSSSVANFSVPVFHLRDFPKPTSRGSVRVVPKHFALGSRVVQRVPQGVRLALPGDILLARVGRTLEDCLALVVHGPCAISDCIFALRTSDEHRERLYRFFESDEGKDALKSSARGVAARFLSKTDLFEIQF